MSKDAASPSQVFLSYSSQDRNWADAVCEELERRQVRCWIAPRDITPGTEWGAAIIEAIGRCQVMVLIFSAHANGSAQVRREVERALSKGLAILPLRVENFRPQGSMEYALSNTHWIDAFTPPAEDRLRHMADSVEALLGAGPAQSPVAGPAPSSSPSRRSRGPWILAAFAIGVMAPVVIGAVVLMGRDRASPPPVVPRNVTVVAGSPLTDAEGFTDETPRFQGRWLVVRETVPLKGPVSKDEVAKRRHRWGIQGDQLFASRNPTETEKASERGTLRFRERAGTRYFDFEGTDQDGGRVVWHGIYDYQDGFLNVCFRRAMTMSGLASPRPTTFPGPDDRGVRFVRLQRAGMGPAKKKGR